MEIEFLGTGGAFTIPQPLCGCRVCEQARTEGLPYSRGGPSFFVHGPDLLIDTPEEIKDLLNRSRVGRIAACAYSHWHPDHVMGRRVFEIGMDFHHWPPHNRSVEVYLPERVGRDFRQRLGSWAHLEYLREMGVVRVNELASGEGFEVGGVRIAPFPLAEEYVYAFLLEEKGKRVLIAPDELNGWEPPKWMGRLDLAVLPMGIVEENPLTGKRNIPQGHPVLDLEATFEQTLKVVERLQARRVILTHIEEINRLSFDDLRELEGKLAARGLDLSFAHDTMVVRV